MAETIQQQLQQLVLIPEASKVNVSASLANESWQAGGLGTLKSQNEEIIEQLGPIIQSAYRTGKDELFKKQVSLFASKKDAEILKLCGDNHQQFVDSLGNLLKIKQNTNDLQEKVLKLNSDLQKTGEGVLTSKQEMLELKKKYRNIELALAATKKCTKVVYMISEFEEQVQAKMYYEAINTLDELKEAYIQRLAFTSSETHVILFIYLLCFLIAESFPAMASNLKSAALSDMREWLYGLKKFMREVGAYLSDSMSKRQDKWNSRNKNVTNNEYVSSAVQFVLDEETEDEQEIKIDLEPLYMCLFVHEKLGFEAEFTKSYANDRKAQINLVMSASEKLFTNSLIEFENMVYDIIGFFIIENNVILSSPDFRSKTDVDVLWDFVVDSLSTIIAKNIQQILEHEKISNSVKNILTDFTFTMEEHSFDVQKLRELISAIFNY
ncbi:Exocyst complex component 6 [Smittium culicis]|uniref:Exocyst complex component 6 n=1 Tax=Smittium culicis TaxID=133412 RepID=A0A1R1XTE5_9FUNG|nr:Exocyst complex component 6 [Smittium culicis]